MLTRGLTVATEPNYPARDCCDELHPDDFHETVSTIEVVLEIDLTAWQRKFVALALAIPSTNRENRA